MTEKQISAFGTKMDVAPCFEKNSVDKIASSGK